MVDQRQRASARACGHCGRVNFRTYLWCGDCGRALGERAGGPVPSAEELVADEVALFARELSKREAPARVLYLRWLVGGWFGLHRLRLGQTEAALGLFLATAIAAAFAFGLQVEGRGLAWMPLLMVGVLWVVEGLALRSQLRQQHARARAEALLAIADRRERAERVEHVAPAVRPATAR